MLLASENWGNNLWTEVLNTACDNRNRLVTKSCTQGRNPFEMIHGRRSSLKNVQVFGCRVYEQKPNHNRDGKFDSRAVKDTLVGFSKSKAYRVLSDEDREVVKKTVVKVCEGDGIIPDSAGE